MPVHAFLPFHLHHVTMLRLTLPKPSPLPLAPCPSLSRLQVPACYLHTPPRLVPAYFSKFQPDTLFYIFYGMPGDEAQLYAADELAAR
jgi:CCR4-NOT transcription complex subunit 2